MITEPQTNVTINKIYDSVSIEDILNLNQASYRLNATTTNLTMITNATNNVTNDIKLVKKNLESTSDNLVIINSTNSTTNDIAAESTILDFNDNPIIVEPEDNLISVPILDDENSANLLFKGLQLSLFERENQRNRSTVSSPNTRRRSELSYQSKSIDNNITRLINLKSRSKVVHLDRSKNAPGTSKKEGHSIEDTKVRNSFKTENITKSIKQYHASNTGIVQKPKTDDTTVKHEKITKNSKNNSTLIKSRESISDSDLIKQSQGLFKEIVRHTKDVHGRNKTRATPASNTANNSIKLIFERAKNRTTDYKIKLKQREHQNAENLQSRALHSSSNSTATDNGTKVAGFLNNDLSSSLGDARLKTLKARILFKDLQSTKDFQQFFNRNSDTDDTDDNDDGDDKVGAETQKITNRIHFPTTFNQLEDKPGKTDIQMLKILPSSSSLVSSSKTIITFQPSYELKNVKTQSYWNNPKFNSQHTNNYATATGTKSYHSGHVGTQYHSVSAKIPDQEDASSAIVNSYTPHSSNAAPHYEQVAAKEVAHFTTIENRPVQRYSIDPPPLQNNYPAAIQNNPSSITQYYRSHPKYSHSPQSSVPVSLPSIVHSSYNTATIAAVTTKQVSSHQTAQRRQHTGKDSVIVKTIPANSWYLNNENERKSYFDAVKRGLLNENGYVFVNNVHQSTNNIGPEPRNSVNTPIFAEPSPLPPPPPAPPTLSRRESTNHINENEDSLFSGVSSYDSPLSSVGKLLNDSNSVTNNNKEHHTQSQQAHSGRGYYYHHPKKTFNF